MPARSLLCAALFASMSAARGAEPAPVEVMILGTFHMSNSGHDLHNQNVPDVLAPEPQAQLQKLAESLAAFRPTRIDVEWDKKTVEERYPKFLEGSLPLSRNEVVQIGFRLGQLTKAAVEGIDADADFPYPAVQAWADKHGKRQELDAMGAQIERTMQEQSAALSTGGIAAELRLINEPARIARSQDFYRTLLRFGDGNEQPGVELLTNWYKRNFLICARIAQQVKPGDRVLVLFGAGHAFLLRQCVTEMPGWKLVEPNGFLPTTISTAPPRGSAGTFRAGMAYRTFTPKEPYDWRGAREHALRTTIWYPAAASAVERPVEIEGLSSVFNLGRAAQDASVARSQARFPLVLLSHGTGGTALSMAWFGEALASHGYVVAGVNHPGNNGGEPYTVEGFSIWWERARDLSTVIDFLLRDETFGARVDPFRIGAAGFSLGGYTMIEIAGGTTDPRLLVAHCETHAEDQLCKSPPEFPTLFEDFKKLMNDKPELFRRAGDSYRDPRVRAVFAMAPALGPALRQASLTKITVPIQMVAAESDTNVPIGSSAGHVAKVIPRAKLYVFPGPAGHYVFLDACPESGRKNNPTLCADAAGVDREAIHAQTVDLAAEFFRATLK